MNEIKMHQAGIPVFPTPERAINALGSVVWITKYRSTHNSLKIHSKEIAH